ncbi:MAG: CapA family protein [Flavobacteriales bacterium]|nr:CapA family protein [Flavobacteriales bacterium]
MSARAQHGAAPSPALIDSIEAFGRQYLGKPYRYNAKGAGPLDCSGFVSHIYGRHGVALPHSSGAIAAMTSQVDRDDVARGDLLFFKGRDAGRNRIGHVAMVVGVSPDGDVCMMHSCHRGIRYDTLSASDYYSKRFVKAGRIAPFRTAAPLTMLAAIADSTPAVDTITIIGVGDIMLGTNYPDAGYLPPNDGADLLAPVDSILRDADLTFGNLEGVLLDGEGHPKQCNDPASCYAFRSPERYAAHLKSAGFDVVSVANNHVGDFGQPGREATLRVLDTLGLHCAGMLSRPSVVFELDSVRYGFCAFAPNTGTIDLRDVEGARAIVAGLDSVVDIVIVSFHGGAEGKNHRRITRRNEEFLGENRGNPYAFARAVIDAGADIVFGHGPHITRAIDLYNDRFIAYSLGNFATYARFNLSGPNGVAPIARIRVDHEGRFIDGRLIPIKQEGEGGPVPDDERRAIREVIELTKADVPEAPIIIHDDGRVSRND